MKRIVCKVISLLMIIAMIFTLTACEKPEEEAKKAVDQTMSALQTGDLEAIENNLTGFSNLTSMFSNSDDSSLNFTDKQINEFFKDVFSNLTYEIKDTEVVDKTTVKVKTRISNVNMQTVILGWYNQIFQIMFKNTDKSDKELNELRLNAFSDEIKSVVKNKDFTDSTIDIEVIKTKDVWKINPSEELLDKVLGGLPSASSK